MNIKTIRDYIASIVADLAASGAGAGAVEHLIDAAYMAIDVADAEKVCAAAAEAKLAKVTDDYLTLDAEVGMILSQMGCVDITMFPAMLDAACGSRDAAVRDLNLTQEAITTLLDRIDPDVDYGDLDIGASGVDGRSLTEVVETHIKKVANAETARANAAEPDTAVIECPVKCEGCSVVLPMAAALHTEDPVYLCGKCAAGAVASERNAAEAKVCELVEVVVSAQFLSGFADHLAAKADPKLFNVAFIKDFLARCINALDSTDDIRAKWCPVSEQDEAQQMVCEMREIILEAADDLDRDSRRHMESGDGLDVSNTEHTLSRGREVVARTDPVAGRWVSKAAVDAITKTFAESERVAIAAKDAAEAKVCELADLATTARSTANTTGWVGNAAALVAAALTSTADIRAKWCPVSEVIGAFTKAGLALGVHSTMGLDAHIKRIVDDSNATIRERDEVGVQLVAAQERLALAMETVDALSMTCLMWSRPDKIKEAKADVMFVRGSLDAVPGDEIKKGGE